LGTYGGLFPTLACFNQAGLTGASSVMDIQPSFACRCGDGTWQGRRPRHQLRLSVGRVRVLTNAT
jgi:hypothetical protein